MDMYLFIVFIYIEKAGHGCDKGEVDNVILTTS
jgi:hypothetical protein